MVSETQFRHNQCETQLVPESHKSLSQLSKTESLLVSCPLICCAALALFVEIVALLRASRLNESGSALFRHPPFRDPFMVLSWPFAVLSRPFLVVLFRPVPPSSASSRPFVVRAAEARR
jgi:hypothetical protein